MIITCNNCYKKFDIDANLIPDMGRLLQCASCDHKWFFKKEVLKNTVSSILEDHKNNSDNIFDQNNPSNNEEINPSDQLKNDVEVDTEEKMYKKIEINTEAKLNKNIEINKNENSSVKTKPIKKKNFKILNIFIVIIISFVVFIIIVDTFKFPIEQVVPNVDFILYNLYETIKDISLFIKDLI